MPLTAEEMEFLKKLDDPDLGSAKKEAHELFPYLDNVIREWRNTKLQNKNNKTLKIFTNLDSILARTVYVNFDVILEHLMKGNHYNRVIASAALGFCRIPDNERFPQVYPRAIPNLLLVIAEGDDALTRNALLALWRLAEPTTPIESILPLMTEHHDPDVRANAALCLAAIVSPEQADRVTPYVLPALRDEEPKVRQHAINILRSLRDRNAVAPLLDLMNDRHDGIRANAALTLGDMDDISVCGILIQNMNRSEVLQPACLAALRKLTGEDFGTDYREWGKWWSDYQETLHDER